MSMAKIAITMNLDKEILDAAKLNKIKTRIPVSWQVEIALEEYLGLKESKRRPDG